MTLVGCFQGDFHDRRSSQDPDKKINKKKKKKKKKDDAIIGRKFLFDFLSTPPVATVTKYMT